MTTATTTKHRRPNLPALATATWKQIVLSLCLAGIAAAAFATSYEHQTNLAIAAAASELTAPLFPVIVEGAIVVSMLVLIWWPDLARRPYQLAWWSIRFWTVLSALGNAASTYTSDPAELLVPVEWAVAVNTVPTVTQYLILHIAHAALARDQLAHKTTTASAMARRLAVAAAGKLGLSELTPEPPAQRDRQPQARPRRTPVDRVDVAGLPTRAELLARFEAGETLAAIEATLGGARKKSWISAQIASARDERDAGRREDDLAA